MAGGNSDTLCIKHKIHLKWEVCQWKWNIGPLARGFVYQNVTNWDDHILKYGHYLTIKTVYLLPRSKEGAGQFLNDFYFLNKKCQQKKNCAKSYLGMKRV